MRTTAKLKRRLARISLIGSLVLIIIAIIYELNDGSHFAESTMVFCGVWFGLLSLLLNLLSLFHTKQSEQNQLQQEIEMIEAKIKKEELLRKLDDLGK
jgi:hypothetical protein